MTKEISQDPNQELINEFRRINAENILKQYEIKNRQRINEASLEVRDAFDQQWKKVTGKPYYLPVTTQEVVPHYGGQNNTVRSDPRGRKYMAKALFSMISWQKLPRRKIGKRFKDLFNIKGIDKETGEERPIYNNLDFESIASRLGVTVKDDIQKASKNEDHGEIEGDFEVDVEGYWKVVFSPQQSPRDTKDVRLMWEGQCLIIQRMQEVVLPGWYIEVADNATRDHFSQTPEEGRKKVGTIQEFPYTVLHESTRQEYLAQKAYGDKIQREALRREENR
jgi:hypothetical protein